MSVFTERRKDIPEWAKLVTMCILLGGILYTSYTQNKIEHKYKASQLELADIYVAHGNLLVKHALTLDSLTLCVAIVNPLPQPTPTEAAALFSEYIQQH